jgi:hypothetical protein
MNIFELIDAYQTNPENFLRMYEADRITVYIPKKGGAKSVAERNVEIRRKLLCGSNYKQIIHEYSLSERQVRRIEMKKSEQPKIIKTKKSKVEKIIVQMANACLFKEQLRYGHRKIEFMKLLGCSVEEFKTYIESLWKPGMTWENYGMWHMDHKIPKCAFNLKDQEQRKICFNFKNIQPLWAHENMAKGRKLYNLEKKLT